MASHCQISTVASRIGLPVGVEDPAGQVGDLADGRGDAVVDDDQVVVGVERQLVGVERPLGQRRGAGELLGEQAAGGEERGAQGAEEDATAADVDGIRHDKWLLASRWPAGSAGGSITARSLRENNARRGLDRRQVVGKEFRTGSWATGPRRHAAVSSG